MKEQKRWPGRPENFACDSDRRTGMHISKMSHSHPSGEVRVSQVSPTAVSTLNIGANRKGWEEERSGAGEGQECLGQSGQGQLQILTKYQTLRLFFFFFFCKVKFLFRKYLEKKIFFF